MLQIVDKKISIRERIQDELGIILSAHNMPVAEFEIHVRRIHMLRFKLMLLTDEKATFPTYNVL